MATENNGRELRKLWEEAGILGPRHGGRQTFSIKRWKMYRYHRVAVIGGTFASKFWQSYDCNFEVVSMSAFRPLGSM